jgi:hypothetical protein
MNTISFLLAALSIYLLVKSTRLVVHFNRRMPELWNLLGAKGRPHRVRELNTDAWSNLPAARYLYDNIDFEVPEIRELKLTLKQLHRSAITSLLLFMGSATATVAVWLGLFNELV